MQSMKKLEYMWLKKKKKSTFSKIEPLKANEKLVIFI